MERPLTTSLRIGDWTVNPAAGQMSRGEETVRVEARTMRLLLCLAERAGEVVSIDDLLTQVWSGVVVTPDSVYQAVTALRRLLGDDPKQPSYIATVPRLGYRMIAPVESVGGDTSQAPVQPTRPNQSPPKIIFLLAIVGALTIGALVFYWVVIRDTAQATSTTATAALNPKSIAVLPFLDLTDGMKEEVFADGMTEELIDKLSKVKGLQVPAPTSSFYYKDKKITVADVAKALRVVYVLDGSVRKSGAMLRVAARLVRADDGYVLWSETYDRPLHDKLWVQDDIAGEVAKALKASIN
jgi:transcriptional activator of cad operon